VRSSQALTSFLSVSEDSMPMPWIIEPCTDCVLECLWEEYAEIRHEVWRVLSKLFTRAVSRSLVSEFMVVWSYRRHCILFHNSFPQLPLTLLDYLNSSLWLRGWDFSMIGFIPMGLWGTLLRVAVLLHLQSRWLHMYFLCKSWFVLAYVLALNDSCCLYTHC
jgi:hypothetical protein